MRADETMAAGERGRGTSSPAAGRMVLLVLWAVAAAGVTWLAASLPPHGFFTGDSGLKLIAALEAIAHPWRPFETNLPEIGGRSAAYVGPMIVPHDGHAHVLQSPVFPVISAPLIAAFGLRGAYVVPVLAFVAFLPLVEALRRRATPQTSPVVLGGIAVSASPLLFYSLEYWEHSPAVALLAASSVAAMRATGPGAARWMLGSGALGGAVLLLRPEAAWYVAGLGLTIPRRCWIAFACGVAIVAAPFAAANYLHWGTPLGLHASVSLSPLARDFLQARWNWIDLWLWPQSAAAAAGLLLVGAAWISGRRTVDAGCRQAIGLTGVAAVTLLAAGRLLPRESFWQAFPLALLAAVPACGTPHTRPLALIAAVAGAGILLTAAHDGGAQWGPRFLLVTTPPLMLLAASAATAASSAGRLRPLRLALVAVILVAGLWTSRAAYREIRGAKQVYARIAEAIANATAQGDVIVTNVWWLDQIAASLHGTRTFLYAPTPAVATTALGDLARSRTGGVHLVSSSEEDGQTLDAAVAATCYRVRDVRSIQERGLRIVSTACAR